MTKKEKKKKKPPFNYPEEEESLVKWFEKTAKKVPDNIAVKTASDFLSYDELNKKANRIARKIASILKDKKITKMEHKDKVAILLDSGIDLYPSLIGVLKSGKITVYLNSFLPIKSLKYYLKDSESNLILTNSANLKIALKLTAKSDKKIKILNTDDISLKISDKNPNLSIKRDCFAFLLYTSGSTGRPKGVLHAHGNIPHYIRWTSRWCPTDKFAIFHSFNYIGSILMLFSALLNGATAIIVNAKRSDLPEFLEKEGITVWGSSVSWFRFFIKTMGQNQKLNKIRIVSLGAEQIYKKDVDLWRKHFSPNCILINRFGHAEFMFYLNYIIDRTKIIKSNAIPIGKPTMKGIKVLILDDDNKEVGINKIGDLAVESDYILSRYWKQPSRIQNNLTPSANGTGTRFITGDLAKMLPDNNIAYAGRRDSLVKIRGVSVNIEEIQNVLFKFRNMEDCRVVLKKDSGNNNSLAAFCVLKIPEKVSILKSYVKSKLSDYCVPDHFVFLDKLPAEKNDLKINRRTLLNRQTGVKPKENYIFSKTKEGGKLAAIWRAILKIDKIGVEDNFFDMGGNSLKAVELISKMAKINWRVTYDEFSKNPTIQGIIAHADKGRPGAMLELERPEIRKKGNSLFKKERYSPVYNYPDYFNCFYSAITEAASWNIKKRVPLSLFPALDLSCVPFYCARGQTREIANSPREILTRENALNFLKIDYQIINFNREKSGLRYLNNQLDKKNIILAIGSPYYIPYKTILKNDNFIEYTLEKRNLQITNMIVLFGWKGKNILAYAANFNSVLKIPMPIFKKYWRGNKSIKHFKKLSPYKNTPPRQILEIRDFNCLKNRAKDLLFYALYLNIEEFFNGKSVKLNGNDIVYFGRRAISQYRKDIADSLNKKRGVISDIQIIDSAERLQQPIFFLKDLLVDLVKHKKSFKRDLLNVNKIIKAWKFICGDLYLTILKNKIDYQYRIAILPNWKLFKLIFLTLNEKKKILKKIDEIIIAQEKLFLSLSRKAKNAEYFYDKK